VPAQAIQEAKDRAAQRTEKSRGPEKTRGAAKDSPFHMASQAPDLVAIYHGAEYVVQAFYDNDPSDPQAFAAFQHWLNTDRHGHPGTLRVCAKSNPDVFSPALDLRGPTDLSGMAAVAEQHLEFQQDDHGVRLVRPGQSEARRQQF
jgi:hypothetical protein